MSFVIRAGFEGSGSPRWLMRCLQRRGLDRAHGFRLDLNLLAESGRPYGTLEALAEGRADVVDSDWLALAEARAGGLPVTAVLPYGRILGSVMLRRDYPGEGLAALRGCRLGVLSLGDKNWAILGAAWAQECGCELAAAVEAVVHPSRAALDAALAAGSVDAALVHWHRVPELARAGHRLLAEIPDLVDRFAAAGTPTTFFVVREAWAGEQPQRVAAFVAAAQAGIRLLRADGAPWRELAAEEGGGLPAAVPLAALRRRWCGRVADCAPWGATSRQTLGELRRRLCPTADGEALPGGMFAAPFLP